MGDDRSSPAPRAAPPGGDLAERQRRGVALGVGLVAVFMTLLDVSIVNVAIPSMDRALGVAPSDVQWVLSGYALTFGLMLVPAGRFGDGHGRRTVFVVGVTLFTITSVAAGLAPTANWLVAARLLQGVAAGLVTPQVTGLIQELFQSSERGRPFGLLGVTVSISTAIGPLLGGLLIHIGGAEHGWRWVFFVNVPIGFSAAVLGWRVLPHRAQGTPGRRRFDPVGLLLLGVGVLLVLLPLVQQHWQSPARWLTLPAGLLTLAAFAGWERWYARRYEPLFDPRLLGIRSFRIGVGIALLFFGGFTAIFFVLTVYLQNGLGHSALAAGLASTPFTAGFVLASIVGGRVISRVGRPLVALGLATVAVSLVVVVLVVNRVPTGATVSWWTATPLLVAGLGSGLVVTPNQALTLAQVPAPHAGNGAGMLETGHRIGSAAGIASVGSVIFAAQGATGDWSAAFHHAMLLISGIAALALCLALADIVLDHR
ncbi:MFS transporter [Salinispora mooreana]|uniref:MFS transporter n=1 Tax=Salinispora mooreana TaxID=999545 RepID=UPI0003A6C4E0|nr:MFS transporter [Salinispora mooreana]